MPPAQTASPSETHQDFSDRIAQLESHGKNSDSDEADSVGAFSADAEAQIHVLEQEVRSLEDYIQSLEKEKESLIERLDEAIALNQHEMYINRFENLVQSLQDEIEALQNEIALRKKPASAQISLLKQRIDELEREMRQLCSKMETRDKKSRAVNHELEAKVTELEKRCQSWRRLYETTLQKDTRNVGHNVYPSLQATRIEVARLKSALEEKERIIQVHGYAAYGENDEVDGEAEEEDEAPLWEQDLPEKLDGNTKDFDEDLATGDLVAVPSETGGTGQENAAPYGQNTQELEARVAELEVKCTSLESHNEELGEEVRVLRRKMSRTLEAFIPRAQQMKHQDKTNNKNRQAFAALERIVREGLQDD
ncbi:MAG: hypothetical protein ASARMPREDX12_001256 [Alectoria sarmentosa]|nr:MAG: hypothetical protein ASARMPREDX12_001256 [Alectoria sarmentosa]